MICSIPHLLLMCNTVIHLLPYLPAHLASAVLYTHIYGGFSSRRLYRKSYHTLDTFHPTSPPPPETLRILRRRRKSINPRSKPVAPFCNLQLNIRKCPRVIVAAQLLSRLISLQHVLTIDGVCVLRPGQSARAGCFDVSARDPGRFLRAIDARVDACLEGLGPRFVGGCGAATCRALDHLCVPCGMKIRRCTVPEDRNLVPADFLRFIVERLNVSQQFM